MAPPPPSVDDMTKQYGTHTALTEAGFAFEAGETLALRCEHGAGIPSLTTILAGTVRPDGWRAGLRLRPLEGTQ